MTYVAVDVDGTLVTSNISFLFGRYLYKKKILSFVSALWMMSLYFLHHVGVFSLKTLHTKIFSSLFKGKSSSYFEEHAKVFFSSQSTLFRPQVMEELRRRKQMGERVVLLSASPDFLVRVIADILKLPESHGTEYLLDEQRNFSAVGQIMTGEQKASLVKEECKAKGERIVAITDSLQDLPLVLVADEVLLVAPSQALRRKLRHKPWKEIV